VNCNNIFSDTLVVYVLLLTCGVVIGVAIGMYHGGR